jgi:signal transduction histidine kinase
MDDPQAPTTARRGDYTVRALGVVLGASALHFVLGSILLALLGGNASVPGQRAALGLIVVFTALLALGFLYIRTQYSSADHVARSIPWVFWTLPPIAAAMFLPVTLPTATLGGGIEPVVHASAPVIAAVWSIALPLGIVVDRLLRALSVRFPPDSEIAMRTFAPPSLAMSHTRILLSSAGAAALIAVGAIAGHSSFVIPSLLTDPTVVVGACMILVLLLLAAVAAGTLGQTPGGDIMSIARRVDALGYSTPTGMGGGDATMADPVVVTSGDETGQLLSRLEELRAHLQDEVQLYQGALDKTREADARKSDFLSAVSHELRTPLNVVGGFAQLLLEGVPAPLSEAQEEDVRLIRAGGQQLLELINDILDMSIIESGELRLYFEATDVAALIHDVVGIHKSLVHDKGVVLQSEIGPDVPSVVCDRRRIMQILTNLVSNAIKFTEEGSITVRAAFDPRSNGVVIRCIDTGIGIEAEDLGAIFEEYRQAGSIRRRTKGTGLGLAIARRIAQHHGGTLTVESTAGEGSTFTLHLPLEPPRRPTTIDMAEEEARNRAAKEAE